MLNAGSRLRAAVVAGAGAVVFVSCVGACAAAGRPVAAAHSVSPVAAGASASASGDSSPTPSASASASAAVPSPTPSRAPTSVAAQGVQASTPKPDSKTTSAANSPKGTASATFVYGRLSASLSGQTLCLTVPVTVSNTGSGIIYDVQIHLFITDSSVYSNKTPLAVAPHASRSITFTLCASGYTGPNGVCDSIYLLSGGEYWGDPDAALAGIADTPSKTISYCIPRQP